MNDLGSGNHRLNSCRGRVFLFGKKRIEDKKDHHHHEGFLTADAYHKSIHQYFLVATEQEE